MYAYMCSFLELFSNAPSCNVCFMKLSCMQTPPLTYYRTHFSYMLLNHLCMNCFWTAGKVY
jgi:hypothetical protein